jgi:hypothetical protein
MTTRVSGLMLTFPARRHTPYRSGPLALCVLLLSPSASATPDFDDVIKSELGLPLGGALLCTVCHETYNGGPGTANKPFGVTARQLGLQKFDVRKLKDILGQMEATKIDSDCDGIGDILELRKGSDPNSPEDASEAHSGESEPACANAGAPQYGVQCGVAGLSANRGTGPRDAAFASVGLVSVLLAARRFRRKWLGHPASTLNEVDNDASR